MAGCTGEFKMEVGVHQQSALSPMSFTYITNETTKECRKVGLWELLYAENLVLTAATSEKVIEMFKQ